MLHEIIAERMAALQRTELSSGVVAELRERILLLEKVNKVLEGRTVKAKEDLTNATNALKALQKVSRFHCSDSSRTHLSGYRNIW